MSVIYRKKVMNARIQWALKSMGLRNSLFNDETMVQIAKFYNFSLVGNSILKKKRCVSRELAKVPGCPTKIELAGKPPHKPRIKWSAQKFDADHYNLNDDSPSEEMIAEFYRSWDWKRLSYDAKIKLGRKCMCCGNTPVGGAVINTDHIKPIRKHWHLRLDLSNLQILCKDCNMGKGSRDETDWR